MPIARWLPRLSLVVGRPAVVALTLLASAFATAALADTRTSPVGNAAGTPFEASCAPGEAIIGWTYQAGEVLATIGPLCQPIQAGAASGHARELDTVGSTDTLASITSSSSACPKGMAGKAVEVHLNAQARVHHLRLSCRDFTGKNPIASIDSATKTTGGEATAHATVQCPVGAYITGLIGSAGPTINSLGLICHTANDDSSGDDNTGNSDGAAGSTRTASAGTTIYDTPAGNEIGYVDPGDTVTIVSCKDDGQGWCKISAPDRGYVWGGDLD